MYKYRRIFIQGQHCKSRSTMEFLLVLLLSSACLAAPSPFVAKIHMVEGEVEYDQTEAYDPLTSDVISHVPGHSRDNITLHEVVKIENELLGLAVWRLLEKDACNIEEIEPERDPTGMMLEAVAYDAKHKAMDIANMRTVYVHAADMGEWKGDRGNLTKDMQELCSGLPIRLVSNSNISKEEFEHLMIGNDRRVQGWPSCGGILSREFTLTDSLRSGNDESVEEEVVHRIVVSD